MFFLFVCLLFGRVCVYFVWGFFAWFFVVVAGFIVLGFFFSFGVF